MLNAIYFDMFDENALIHMHFFVKRLYPIQCVIGSHHALHEYSCENLLVQPS